MSAPRLPRESAPTALGVLVTAMLLVAACFGVLAAIEAVVKWWRGGMP